MVDSVEVLLNFLGVKPSGLNPFSALPPLWCFNNNNNNKPFGRFHAAVLALSCCKYIEGLVLRVLGIVNNSLNICGSDLLYSAMTFDLISS